MHSSYFPIDTYIYYILDICTVCLGKFDTLLWPGEVIFCRTLQTSKAYLCLHRWAGGGGGWFFLPPDHKIGTSPHGPHIMLRDLLTQKSVNQKTVTDFRYPRAPRFQKYQIENRLWELPRLTFFKTWFLALPKNKPYTHVHMLESRDILHHDSERHIAIC
jgi:hypothetical protein